jgi:hypothetical protein
VSATVTWVDATEPRLLLAVPSSQSETVPNVGVKVRASPVAIHQLERNAAMVDLEIDPVEELEVDGVPARMVRFAFGLQPAEAGPEPPRMRCAQVYLVRSALSFLITFTAAASDFDAVEPQFRELMESFRFREPT